MSGERDGMPLTRRGFMAGLAAISAIGTTGRAGAQETLQRFRALSARLTGFPAETLDPALADGLIDAIVAAGDGAGLERLLSDAVLDTAEADELARRIVVAWYSGIHPTAGTTSVRNYMQALVWRALDFTKPPGTCSVEPGDWSRPPSPAGAAP